MNKEFKLSEKRKRLLNYLKEQFGEKSLIPNDIMSFVYEGDKEFIRRLKEEINTHEGFECHHCKEKWNGVLRKNEAVDKIDKLSGEELKNE